ncbi:caspase family protein [Streptomyces sp. NBC_00250]|uniref:HD domain-containing protein n=1 Tax=Streptomyces sp. NBC_00250 TaxID=2903641 RepID=UPI002E2B4779|nr:caspase family protein [Streptomyces sp. NBC_00250]
MAEHRTALLIAVASAPEAAHRFEALEEAVAADQRELEAALRASGYAVVTLWNATRADISTKIHEVSRDVPPDGTLLVHFSGHGVRIGDTDYLVPFDARAPRDDTWHQPYVDTLLPADISPSLSVCAAGTVLWLIDACRSDPDAARPLFASSILKGQPSGRFVLMTSCAAGQRSGCTPEGSFFTLALAEALGPLTRARTTEEVYEATKRQTLRLAHRHRRERQEPQVRYGSEMEAEARATVICEGRPLLEAWRAAARDTEVWHRVARSDPERIEELREQLAALAESCAAVVHQARARMPDPWADDSYPVRLLLHRLPGLLPAPAELSEVEAAALVAAPFLHEAAWARRLSQARDVEPYGVHRQEDGDARRRHYEQVAEHHPHIARKLTDSWLGGKHEEAVDIALWLVHRWITELFETDEEPVPDTEAGALASALMNGTPGGDRVGVLARALRTVAAGIALGAPEEAAAPEKPARILLPAGHQTLRVREIAALLRLAAVLSLDVRALPDVVAEHLAVSDPVTPADLIDAARTAAWDRDARGLHLDLACAHPATHAAFAATVEQADELARTLRESAHHLPPGQAALLDGVPERVTDRSLRPRSDSGDAAYDVPLLRFSLAQTEVRDLLMGERLYDDEPALALRELYQNAMDACRYRAMRWRYLSGRGCEPAAWQGRISIEAGEDERGPFVECRDNGVGMDVEQLTNTFTQAGRRFGQTRSFRREQAAWLRHDRELRLYPNSRFGIGVFSYFMLADEMSIVTRPVSPEGSLAHRALRVDISSSGSLFRVQESGSAESGLPEGGTRVRLYLRGASVATGLSCVATLRRHVLVSEFDLRVRDASGHSHHWLPGQLQFDAGHGGTVEAVPGVLWWVPGRGAVLCDGIVTDQAPFGHVLNLSGRHAGDLSINRKKLTSYDRRWAASAYRDGAERLAGWPGLTFDWLWSLESNHPSAAGQIWEAWRGRGLRVKRQPWEPDASLDTTGWFTWDAHILQREPAPYRNKDRWAYTRAWRAAALDEPSLSRDEAVPASLAGYPIPAPGWATVVSTMTRDWRTAVQAAQYRGVPVAAVLRTARALRVAHARLAPPPVLSADGLDWTPDRTDAEIMKGLLGDESDVWSAPKENDYRHAPDDFGGLVRASYAGYRPLGELTDHCTRYAPFLRHPLPTVPPHHRDHVCDKNDLDMLYVEEHGTWRRTRWPWDVVRAARGLGTDPLALRDRMAGFAWLGWTVPSAEEVERWSEVPHDIGPVLESYVREDADGTVELTWAATVECAERRETTLRSAERELARWVAYLGWRHHRRYRGKASKGLALETEASRILAPAPASGIRPELGLTLRDLAYLRPHSVDWAELSYIIEDLAKAGFEVPPAGALMRAWDGLSLAEQCLFSGQDPSFVGADYPVLPTEDVLFSASVMLRTSLGSTWKKARREAKKAGLTVPPLPEGLAGLRPGREASWALLDHGVEDEDGSFHGEWFEPPRWTPLTGARLARYAQSLRIGVREAYRRLDPLRALGALVPALTDAEVVGLPERVPTGADIAALSSEHHVSPEGEPLCPLDLLSIAARLGEPIGSTWQRLVPYLPLQASWGSRPPHLSEVSEAVPLWQDLIALSVHGDGMLPALHGRVDADRIAFAARATGESEAWTAERLRLYAPLFALEPDSPEGEDDGD